MKGLKRVRNTGAQAQENKNLEEPKVSVCAQRRDYFYLLVRAPIQRPCLPLGKIKSRVRVDEPTLRCIVGSLNSSYDPLGLLVY